MAFGARPREGRALKRADILFPPVAPEAMLHHALEARWCKHLGNTAAVDRLAERERCAPRDASPMC